MINQRNVGNNNPIHNRNKSARENCQRMRFDLIFKE